MRSKFFHLLLLGCLGAFPQDLHSNDEAKAFTNSIGMAMIRVEAGSVKVAKAPKPEFAVVSVDSAYYLAATEVTQAQWQRVMGSNPSYFKGSTLPVEWVNWTDAMAFCQRLTEHDQAAGKLPKGYVYTLPSEAQWEFACRAGTTGDYAGPLDQLGWFDANSGFTTHGVGEKKPNAWGFYDMHGNVWEWCADRDETGRAFRGGCWVNFAVDCRSGYRYWFTESSRYHCLGFRPAAVPSR